MIEDAIPYCLTTTWIVPYFILPVVKEKMNRQENKGIIE